MSNIKVLVPIEASNYIKAIASTDSSSGETVYTIDQRFLENESGQLYFNQCDGQCGMNYCDENGCIERTRHLVSAVPIDPTY